MDLGLKDRVGLVCGASKGLGRAVAEGLAREGTKLAICSRNRDHIIQTASQIAAEFGVEVLGIAADLSDAQEARAFFQEARKHFGKVDILVTNAGGPPSLPFDEISDAQWKKAFDLTLMSAVILIREALPLMKENGYGRIVNLTSVAVKQPIEGLILSNSLRTGLVGLAKTLSTAFASRNITINNVCPGYTLTERVKELSEGTALRKGVSVEDVFREWESQIPMGRLGRPEELASLVVFLASEKASYLTGTTIQVDGGYFKGLM
jgi:3-oxoacyl-[acyl-carrier protein] reductase